MSKKRPQKMTKTAMKLFGYKELWPAGNTKKSWWRKGEEGTYYELPTIEEFLDDIKEKGKEELRDEINNGLGKLFNLIRM